MKHNQISDPRGNMAGRAFYYYDNRQKVVFALACFVLGLVFCVPVLALLGHLFRFQLTLGYQP
jgi:hypothetical protein